MKSFKIKLILPVLLAIFGLYQALSNPNSTADERSDALEEVLQSLPVDPESDAGP